MADEEDQNDNGEYEEKVMENFALELAQTVVLMN